MIEIKPLVQVTKSLKRLKACTRSAKKSNHPKRWHSDTRLVTDDLFSTFASVDTKNSSNTRL